MNEAIRSKMEKWCNLVAATSYDRRVSRWAYRILFYTLITSPDSEICLETPYFQIQKIDVCPVPVYIALCLQTLTPTSVKFNRPTTH